MNPVAITQNWRDVSVDTIEGYRRRGLAGAAFVAIAGHFKEQEKAPVWGASENNPASMEQAVRAPAAPRDDKNRRRFTGKLDSFCFTLVRLVA